jgi:hypothetical protein
MFDVIIPTNGGSLPDGLIGSLVVHTDRTRVRITTVGQRPYSGKNFFWVECPDPCKAKRINMAIECTYREYIVLLNSQCKLLPQPWSQWLDMLYYAVTADGSHAAAGPLKLHHLGTDYIDFFCVIIPRKVWLVVGPLEEDVPFQEAVVSWFKRAKNHGLAPKAVTEAGHDGHLRVGSFPIYYSGKDEPDTIDLTKLEEGLLFKKERRSPSRDSAVPVVAHISTKDRHSTTLPLAIQAIALQDVVPCQLLIFDDNRGKHLFYSETLYEHLFNVLSSRGCEVQVIAGGGLGQVANHQKALDMAKVDLLWRVDDDNSPEPNVLRHLYQTIQSDPSIGAVASLVHFPWIRAEPIDVRSSGAIADVKAKQNVQWFTFQGIREVQHLHNTFLFKKSAARHGYPKNLSTVGHREETIFTAQMALDGWKLVVAGDVITWHLRDPQGGIRSFQDTSLWNHDEQIFSQWALERGIHFNDYWLIVLDNGLGDHWVFKHILPDVITKATTTKKTLLLAVCYPEVFEDVPHLNVISIHDAKRLACDQFEKHNVYNFMIERRWTGTLLEAFKAMHVV